MSETQRHHQSVMLQESIDLLQVKPNEWYVDATFGRGGHTAEILKRGGNVIALDFDEEAILAGTQRFEQEIKEEKLILIRDNFDRMQQVVLKQVAGVLFDFGTSVEQLTNSQRGLSFEGDGPLDMRLDTRLGVTAAQLLGVLPEKELTNLFSEFGGERESKTIAKAIVRERALQPIQTTAALAKLVARTKREHTKLHPATKVFQALRIAVNTELDNIKSALPQALAVAKSGGRVVTIAFHEGEDALVKHQFISWEDQGLGVKVTPKPLVPSEAELIENPRARSAKLRAFEKR